MNPYKDPETGKYKHGYWSETSGEKITFDWPGHADQVCEMIERTSRPADLLLAGE